MTTPVAAPAPSAPRPFYVTGGTLPSDASSYVVRQADKDLLDGLLAGEFCYVLNTRQMGKSSLMIRTANRLREQGVTVAVLDLTAVGQNLSPEQWYDGLLVSLGEQLHLEDELDDFWEEHKSLGPLQRFFAAVGQIVLQRLGNQRLVLFVDEIDAVRSLRFSADEFFAGIRESYNRRRQDPVWERLAFCLLGVATPADLISDTRMSPFNVGRRIVIADFTPGEAAPLARGLGQNGNALLARTLYWTGGHPYMTQRLCRSVAEEDVDSARAVDALCERLFLTRQARDTDDNLAFVRNRLLRSEADLAALLDLYTQVRAGRKVKDDETNPLIPILRLSGVAKVDDAGNLRVRNPIYDRVFDKEWVLAHLPDAELRRQKAAYRRGVLRAAAVFGGFAAALCVLALVALRQAQRANAGEQAANAATREARAERTRAVAGERAARDATGQARTANTQAQAEKTRALRLAADRAAALEQANAARHEADAKAQEARDAAGRATRSAEQARLAALGEARERGRAEREATNNRRNLYVAQVNRAQTAIEAGEYIRARELLEQQRPRPGQEDLRDFAWRYLWDQVRDRSLATFPGTQETAAVFSPDGKTVAAAGENNILHLWDLKTKRETARFKGHTDSVDSIAFSPDGWWMASGAQDKTVRLWDRKTNRLVRVFPAFGERVQSVVFSPDGKTLAAGSADGFAKLWDAATRREVMTLRAGRPIHSLAFFPDNKRLALSRGTANSDYGVQLWDLAARQVVNTLDDAGGAMALSPDGTFLAAVHYDKASNEPMVRLWNLAAAAGKERAFRELKGHTNWILDLQFSPDGRTLASASFDGTARLWNVADGTEKQVIRGHRGSVEHIAFSPDNKRLVTASKDFTVKVWDVAPSRKQTTFVLSEARSDFRLSAGNKKLAVLGADNAVHLTDLGTGRESVLRDPGRAVGLQDFSQNGRTLVTIGQIKVGFLRNLGSGQQTPPVKAPATLQVMAASPDKRIAALGLADNSVHLWNGATGREVGAIRSPETNDMLCVSPDGRSLATYRYDPSSRRHTVRLWNVPTRRAVQRQ